jgi:hypothetical protein
MLSRLGLLTNSIRIELPSVSKQTKRASKKLAPFMHMLSLLTPEEASIIERRPPPGSGRLLKMIQTHDGKVAELEPKAEVKQNRKDSGCPQANDHCGYRKIEDLPTRHPKGANINTESGLVKKSKGPGLLVRVREDDSNKGEIRS